MKITLSPQALLDQMGPTVYREAFERGLSLSAHLETLHPSSEYRDGLDAFERLLMLANIRLKSMPEHGIMASTFEDFNKTPQLRALVPEWLSRIARGVAFGKSSSTRGLFSSDELVGSSNNPWVVSDQERWSDRLASPIPLSSIVGVTTGISTDAYRAYYLELPAVADRRASRVAEGAPIPVAKLRGGDHTVRLYKFGGGIGTTYEVLRRQRLDRIALYMQITAMQAEIDKVATVIDVLVNGDGNSGTSATNYNLTALDGDATAGTMSTKGWLAFQMKFPAPFTLNTILATEQSTLQLLLLNAGTANPLMAAMSGLPGFSNFAPINPGLQERVRVGWTSDAPALKIVAFDSRVAIERVYEIGSDIQEITRYASNQTEELTMTEHEGYVKFEPKAVLTLDINA